jgi:hypothetical protein
MIAAPHPAGPAGPIDGKSPVDICFGSVYLPQRRNVAEADYRSPTIAAMKYARANPADKMTTNRMPILRQLNFDGRPQGR